MYPVNFRKIVFFAATFCSCLLAQLSANVPGWWSDYGVGPDVANQNDADVMDANYQPALLGQAKFMAYQAYQAMEAAEKGSAGPEVEAMVLGFSTAEDDNYQVLLLGQLKQITQPFYTRFEERNFDVSASVNLTSEAYPYPWKNPADYSGDDMDMNYEPANVGQMKYLFSFDLENWAIPSTLTLDTVNGAQVKTLEVTLSGGITTTNFGSLTVNGDVIAEVTSAGSYSFEYPLANEGENVISLVFEDQSGNAIERSITIYRDTQAPILTFGVPAPDVYYTNEDTVDFIGTVNDSLATVTVDGSANLATDGSFSYATPILDIGDNRFVFETVDALGNVRTYTRTIVYDDSVPAIADTSIPLDQDTYTNQSTLSYGGTLAVDDTLYINGRQIQTASNGGGGFEFLHEVNLIEGANDLTIRVIDAAGNSFDQTITIYYDVTAPVFTSLSADVGLLTNINSAVLSGSVDDPEATVSINGSSTIVNNDGTFSSGALTLAEGNNLITVGATDRAGNNRTQTLEIVYDATAPQILSFGALDVNETLITAVQTYTFTGVLDDTEAILAVTGGNAALPRPLYRRPVNSPSMCL